MNSLKHKRLAPADVARLGAVGLRTRPMRAVLAALGIAIGIAAMLAVVGISFSGRADLQAKLDALGTNLLSVEGGKSEPGGQAFQLADRATAMIERIPPVLNAVALSRLPDSIHVSRLSRV